MRHILGNLASTVHPTGNAFLVPLQSELMFYAWLRQISLAAGRIAGARKQLNHGKIVSTFALGSRYLYDGINRNPDIEFFPVDYTNLPHNIMQNDRKVSINNTTQIDLQG